MTYFAAPPKSPGIAVLLTIIWLGAGHLYANRIATGLFLMVSNLFLVMVSFIPFAIFLTAPVWFICAIVACIFAARAAQAPSSAPMAGIQYS